LPFDFPEDQKVDIGDQQRSEGEKFVNLKQGYVKNILTRRINPADRMISNPRHITQLVQEITHRLILSPKSLADINTAFYYPANRTHIVGIVNERIDSMYASSFGKVPTGLNAGFVGFLLADSKAVSNAYYVSEIVKHISGSPSDLTIEEVPKEEVQPELRSEETNEEPVGPLKGLYPFKE